MSQWLTQVYPGLSEAQLPALQCTTRPGEIVLDPGWWAHATLNSGAWACVWSADVFTPRGRLDQPRPAS